MASLFPSRAVLAAMLVALLAMPVGLTLTAVPSVNPADVLSNVAVMGAQPAPTQTPGVLGLGPERQVTHDGSWQNEPNLAVNPTDGQNIVTGSNDYRWHGQGGFVWTGAYTTHDGGATWKEQPLPGCAQGGCPAGTGVLPFGSAGDFIAAGNSLGTMVAGGIDFSGSISFVFASASNDGGDSWLPPELPGADLQPSFQDKPDMAGDPASPLVYMCWTNFLPGFASEFIATSTSVGGAAWTPGIPATLPGRVQGCSMAVAGDGSVLMAYQVFNGCLSCGGTLQFVKSPVGGAAWSLPVQVATESPVGGASFRVNGFPLIAADRSNGNIYVVWNDNRLGNADIWMAKSTDGGATWAAPVRVNQDTGSAGQFQPNVAVGNDGAVYVSYQDQRNGGYTYFVSTSTDGGATFTDRALASGPSSNASTGGFFGDYTDIQVGPDGVAHAVWTDGRTGGQDIYTRGFN